MHYPICLPMQNRYRGRLRFVLAVDFFPCVPSSACFRAFPRDPHPFHYFFLFFSQIVTMLASVTKILATQRRTPISRRPLGKDPSRAFCGTMHAPQKRAPTGHRQKWGITADKSYEQAYHQVSHSNRVSRSPCVTVSARLFPVRSKAEPPRVSKDRHKINDPHPFHYCFCNCCRYCFW